MGRTVGFVDGSRVGLVDGTGGFSIIDCSCGDRLQTQGGHSLVFGGGGGGGGEGGRGGGFSYEQISGVCMDGGGGSQPHDLQTG